MNDPIFILAVLSLLVAISEWLVQHTFIRHFGTALFVILLTALVANLGIIPTGADEPVPVYNSIFTYIAPLAIFFLLLEVNLRDIIKAGLPMIGLFLIGSLATVIGVLVGMLVINGPTSIGDDYAALGGMFVGTYTGGSVNFNALAINYDIMREGVLYSGAVVVDNIITTVWMVITIALPRLLAPLWRGVKTAKQVAGPDIDADVAADTETLHPIHLGGILAIGLGGVWIAEVLTGMLADAGITIPSILVLTVIALALAQVPAVQRMRGARLLGMYTVYIFLAVIGAFCDIGALRGIGQLGVSLLLFATILVLIHGVITYGAARLLKIDLGIASVASQANVGGGTSALALARSIGRSDLVLSAILVGALGNGIGTFLGFWASESLLPWLF